MKQFTKDIKAHVNEVKFVFDKFDVKEGAPGGGMMGGGGVGGAAGGGVRGQPGQVNTMATPSAFGGGGGAGAGPGGLGSGAMNPTERKLQDTFNKIDVHMKKFESTLQPLFKKVPAPQALKESKKLKPAELKI